MPAPASHPYDAVRFVAAQSSIGWMALAATRSGVCWLSFGDAAAALEAELRDAFPAAEPAPEDRDLSDYVASISAYLDRGGCLPHLPLDLRGSPFRLRVWEALREIPVGETRTYGEVAAAIDAPASTRAVASACAGNRVALLVPCHRVVRRDGGLGGFRWGLHRKTRLLELEARAFEMGALTIRRSA